MDPYPPHSFKKATEEEGDENSRPVRINSQAPSHSTQGPKKVGVLKKANMRSPLGFEGVVSGGRLIRKSRGGEDDERW